MARIKSFKPGTISRNSIHDGIDATYSIISIDDRSFLQIDTHGRETREIPGKKSQTIQLNRNSGQQLFKI
jgi:hypothetical protein